MVLMTFFGAASLNAQAPHWAVDVTPASYVEAWDLNDEREALSGVQSGIDRLLWRGLAISCEAVLLHVRQADGNTWLRGATVGMRARREVGKVRLFLDLGGGRSSAPHRVPPSGTRSNYILLLGGGVEIPRSLSTIVAGARWFHVSNNGSEGRHRNPDIQALGGFVGIGRRF
jgi:hypothetical protein